MTKRLGLIMLLLLLPALSAQADIRGKEVVNTYAVSGVTGRALYDSIGERGPKVGIARAIAHTTFDRMTGDGWVKATTGHDYEDAQWHAARRQAARTQSGCRNKATVPTVARGSTWRAVAVSVVSRAPWP